MYSEWMTAFFCLWASLPSGPAHQVSHVSPLKWPLWQACSCLKDSSPLQQFIRSYMKTRKIACSGIYPNLSFYPLSLILHSNLYTFFLKDLTTSDRLNCSFSYLAIRTASFLYQSVFLRLSLCRAASLRFSSTFQNPHWVPKTVECHILDPFIPFIILLSIYSAHHCGLMTSSWNQFVTCLLCVHQNCF